MSKNEDKITRNNHEDKIEKERKNICKEMVASGRKETAVSERKPVVFG